jgi:flagellar hook assembly protein FlgD
VEKFHVLNKKLKDRVRQLRLSDIPEYHALMRGTPDLVKQSTVIEFYLHKKSEVKLTVQDNRGKDIATLISTPLKKGKYSISWNSDNLPSGEYNFHIKVGKFIETKKFRLIK